MDAGLPANSIAVEVRGVSHLQNDAGISCWKTYSQVGSFFSPL